MRRLLREVASAITVAWCGAAAGAQPELGSYEVTVNTRSTDGAVFAARDAAGRLYLDESAMRNSRVRLSGAERIEIDGLDFAPAHLAGTRFDAQPAASRPVALAPHWGGFFNYSLFGYTALQRASAKRIARHCMGRRHLRHVHRFRLDHGQQEHTEQAAGAADDRRRSRQTVAPGVYSDTLTITVTWN